MTNTLFDSDCAEYEQLMEEAKRRTDDEQREAD